MRTNATTSQTTEARSSSATAAESRLKKACTDFEAMLVKQLLATAHVGESEDGVFETDSASETLSDLRLNSLADALSKGKGFGVAAMLEKQLTQGKPGN